MSVAIGMQSKKERDVNLDLLRIVSMFLIVFLHSIDHSGVLEAANVAPALIKVYVNVTYALTQVCVNCYVLISGYYLVKSKFRLQKLVALWLEVIFYSITIKALFMISGEIPFLPISLISCFLPVFTGRYWFITIYFGLYILAPFLNVLIYSLDKRKHMMLNIVLFVLFSAWVSFHPSIAGMNSGRGWGIAWFVVLYFLAAWFRLYYQPSYKWLSKFAGWIIASTTVGGILSAGGGQLKLLDDVIKNCYTYDSFVTYISTVCIFAAFLNIKIDGLVVKRLIHIIAPSTLGIYLIHAHADFSPWLWLKLNLPGYMDSVRFILYQLIVVLGIFVLCSFIDIVRANTIGRIEKSELLCRVCESATNKFYSIVKE